VFDPGPTTLAAALEGITGTGYVLVRLAVGSIVYTQKGKLHITFHGKSMLADHPVRVSGRDVLDAETGRLICRLEGGGDGE